MTDEQIIEALADIMFGENKKCGFRNCNLACEVLDLINRQKAKVEMLRNTVKTDFLTATEQLKLSQSEIGQIRAEAVKWFAERLKEKSKMPLGTLYGKLVYLTDIDNLAKEMTEDEKK